MRKSICAICGRAAAVGSLCEEHYAKLHELFSIGPVKVDVCDECGAVRDQAWKRFPLDEALKDAIRRKIKTRGRLERIDIKLGKVGERYSAIVSASGTIPPRVPKNETKRIEIRIRRIKCPSCIKLLGRYHEAVVQLRGPRAERLAELVAEIVRGMPMRVERLKYGSNLYVVNKADARALIKQLAAVLKREKEEAPQVVRSYKLVGKKDGKELWRDFYAIR